MREQQDDESSHRIAETNLTFSKRSYKETGVAEVVQRGSNPSRGKTFYSFSEISALSLGSIRPPVQWVLWSFPGG